MLVRSVAANGLRNWIDLSGASSWAFASYRAQMKGWKFPFLAHTEVPAELPPEIAAFKAQQYRWTKGGAQTCRELLPMSLKSDFSGKIKLEAFWHLTSNRSL